MKGRVTMLKARCQAGWFRPLNAKLGLTQLCEQEIQDVSHYAKARSRDSREPAAPD